MYSRDEIRALTDKVLNMAKADAVEVGFDGRGSDSIDQQRDKGQFGGNCFREIKNGRVIG